jgi:hypothetical protein
MLASMSVRALVKFKVKKKHKLRTEGIGWPSAQVVTEVHKIT